MFRSLRTLRSIPRIKDIAWVLGKHGFHQVAGSLQAPVTTRLRRLFNQAPSPVIQQPERLRMVLEELGPTFIKFGQLLSTRPDILPEAYIQELCKLRDEVRPASFEEVREVLEEELGADVDRHFRSIDSEPLAAASIAQVHRAVTRDGEQVVIKVRKRGLERVVEQDLLVLGLLAEFLRDWPGLKLFDPEGIVRSFERSIRRELDFLVELSNLDRLRAAIPSDSRVYLPRTYAELSTSGVLTMEFLPGVPMSHVQEAGLDAEQRAEVARQVALTVLGQVFEQGLFHADPHPGNFILLDDGRVGLIDLGNVGRILPEMMDDLVVLLVALSRKDFHRLARWILRQGKPSVDVNVETLAGELLDSLDQYYGLQLGQIRVGDLFNALFGLILRYGITVPSQYVTVGRTFVILEGTVRLCAPEMEILPEISPYALRILKARWRPERLLRELEKEGVELLSILRRAPHSVSELLDRVADGHLRIETHDPDRERLERKLEAISAKVPLALVSGAFIVAGGLLLSQADPAAGALPRILGTVCLVLAGFLGLRLLLR